MDTISDGAREVALGVDTHLDLHVAALLDHSFYEAGQRFLTLHYEIERLAVEHA